jgi:hypothetical protein
MDIKRSGSQPFGRDHFGSGILWKAQLECLKLHVHLSASERLVTRSRP